VKRYLGGDDREHLASNHSAIQTTSIATPCAARTWPTTTTDHTDDTDKCDWFFIRFIRVIRGLFGLSCFIFLPIPAVPYYDLLCTTNPLPTERFCCHSQVNFFIMTRTLPRFHSFRLALAVIVCCLAVGIAFTQQPPPLAPNPQAPTLKPVVPLGIQRGTSL